MPRECPPAFRSGRAAHGTDLAKRTSVLGADRMCGGLTEQRKSLTVAVQIPAFQPLTQDELV